MKNRPTASRRRLAKRLLVAGATIATAALLSACASGTSGGTQGNTAADKFGTKDNPITLTFWGWGSTEDKPMEAAYHKLHPNVTIKTVQLGSTAALYTKLATVFKSGTGAPDLTALELPMLSSFAAGGKNLAPLGDYGGSVTQYDPAAARAATFGGKLYAIPTDYGPTVMYYRTDVFDKYGLTVPTTWDEYLADAKKLKAAAPDKFMTFVDPGDSTPALSMIWGAGGHPFDLSGTKNLTINLQDAGSKKYADYWSNMLKSGYASATPAWDSAWFNQLGAGEYATWFAGAWGTSVLQQSVPKSAGNWKVANVPAWSAGAESNGAMGGSGTAVTQASKHKAAGTAFAEWYGTQWPLTNVGKAGGATFPASLTVQKDPAYAKAPSEVLGGQVAVPIYLKASASVAKGWQFLPYNLYANTIFKDTVGQHIATGFDINAGLKEWQDQLVTYGKNQGFDVKG